MTIPADIEYKPHSAETCTPCKTYEELRDFCYQEWFKSEGKISYVYADSKGYPTTSVGLLIYRPAEVKDGKVVCLNGTKEQQRAVFQQDFNFYNKNLGRYLTYDEKGKFFDRIVADYERGKLGTDYRNNPYPSYTLQDSDVKSSFDKRFAQWYNSAKKSHPDLLEMPRSLAQTMMHMYWWGKGKAANDVSCHLPYDKQAAAVCSVAYHGTPPNDAIISDLNAAIADCQYVVYEASITRHPDGSIDHFEDMKKTVLLCTQYPKGKVVNEQKVKEVWYRQDHPNKGGIDYTIGIDDVRYEYHEDGKTLHYTADKDGLESYYREDGKTKSYTKDAQGYEIHYRDDGATKAYTKDAQGYEIHYRDDGTTKAYTKDVQGYEVHYRDDGTTKAYTKDVQGYEVHYRDDGTTKAYTKDAQGYEVHYRDDGATKAYTKDAQGNETHYKEDDKTIEYIKDALGNKAYYCTNGKIDYTLQEGGSVYYNGNEHAVAVQQNNFEVKLSDGSIAALKGINSGQKYTVYYCRNQNYVSKIENNENGTVYYKPDGKVDYVEDKDGNKVSQRLFGKHPRKEYILRAEELKADALMQLEQLQIEKKQQSSIALIEKMEIIKEKSTQYVQSMQDLHDSLATQRTVAEFELQRKSKESASMKTRSSHSLSKNISTKSKSTRTVKARSGR